VLAEEARGGPSRERSWAALSPEARQRRARSAGAQGQNTNPNPSSRLSPGRLLAGRWAASLASEPTGVLVHTGFGAQLLSMRLGEGGAGLSLGADPQRFTIRTECEMLSGGQQLLGLAHCAGCGPLHLDFCLGPVWRSKGCPAAALRSCSACAWVRLCTVLSLHWAADGLTWPC